MSKRTKPQRTKRADRWVRNMAHAQLGVLKSLTMDSLGPKTTLGDCLLLVEGKVRSLADKLSAQEDCLTSAERQHAWQQLGGTTAPNLGLVPLLPSADRHFLIAQHLMCATLFQTMSERLSKSDLQLTPTGWETLYQDCAAAAGVWVLTVFRKETSPALLDANRACLVSRGMDEEWPPSLQSMQRALDTYASETADGTVPTPAELDLDQVLSHLTAGSSNGGPIP